MINEYKEFSMRLMGRTNYFGFCATLFYVSGLNALYALQAVTISIALLAIFAAHSIGLALMVLGLYLIAISLREGCNGCAQIQAFMIIAFAMGLQSNIFKQTGLALIFAAWFGVWYLMSKRIYDHSDNA